MENLRRASEISHNKDMVNFFLAVCKLGCVHSMQPDTWKNIIEVMYSKKTNAYNGSFHSTLNIFNSMFSANVLKIGTLWFMWSSLKLELASAVIKPEHAEKNQEHTCPTMFYSFII